MTEGEPAKHTKTKPNEFGLEPLMPVPNDDLRGGIQPRALCLVPFLRV